MKKGSSFGNKPSDSPAGKLTNVSDSQSVDDNALREAINRLQPGVPAKGNNWAIRLLYFFIYPMYRISNPLENPPDKYKVVWDWEFGMALVMTLFCLSMGILGIVSLV